MPSTTRIATVIRREQLSLPMMRILTVFFTGNAFVISYGVLVDDITQNGLLPSTKDPNLWIVKCRIGEEKLICMQIMRKAIAFENSDDQEVTYFNFSRFFRFF